MNKSTTRHQLMAFVTVKVSNVEFDFSGSDVDDLYQFNLKEDYQDKVFEVEVNADTDDEYFEDYLIEELTDHISNVGGWPIKDYDYDIVTVRSL